jgi:riboflavin biosynthesis pyrimidine reductase
MLAPLDVLYEADGLPAFDLPESLAELYGGSLGLDEPCMVANFVASIDGVVAIPSVPSSNKLIAGGSEADRFVLGLLRAWADVLVIGSGTMLAAPRSVWTPEQAFPDAADGFAELRRRLGRPERLEVAVLSGSGRLDPDHPAFAAGASVLTTDQGAERLSGRLAPDQIVSLGGGDIIGPAAAVAALRARGHEAILSEGGPHALGPLLEAGLVDELFLTVSPLLVGRDERSLRLGLVEGADLLPGGPLTAHLAGVRLGGDHLFLRYRLERTTGSDRHAAV